MPQKDACAGRKIASTGRTASQGEHSLSVMHPDLTIVEWIVFCSQDTMPACMLADWKAAISTNPRLAKAKTIPEKARLNLVG
jgi:hypothetical protein